MAGNLSSGAPGIAAQPFGLEASEEHEYKRMES